MTKPAHFTYRYARPALTVDAVVFGYQEPALQLLLIQRGQAPFAGRWALPGGFVEVGESPDQAVRRELAEEAGLRDLFLEQLYTFGEPKRDPREHVVTVAYFALVRPELFPARADSDAADARWFPVEALPPLAFDHAEIVSAALARLRSKVRYQPIGFELLPQQFTLTMLQRLYEAVLNEPLDKRNFRKKMLGFGLLRGLPERVRVGRQRPAQLFAFDEERYERLRRKGFLFEL